MRVPSKYLFYDGLPNAKDIDKIMADNGYQSPDIVQAVALPGLDISQRQGPINAADSINTNNLQPAQMDWNDNLFPRERQHNPNHFGQYFNTALGIADSLIPGEKIHKNYVTQPLPVYNPYPSGTGSQAIMDQGGYISDSGADVYAKDGNWIKGAVNPAHKGYCTPMTKSTCTPRRKAFAMTMKKHHGFHEDGGNIDGSFTNLEAGGNLEGFVYGRTTGDELMLEPYDKITAKTGIHIKPENRGKFTAYKKRTGKTTEEALHSSDPHIRKMANFARNAKKWHHGKAFDGISLYPYDIEMADDGLMLESYDKITAENGLSSDKAKEMLRDGTANGKKLTAKQKRYFGWVAGGKADNGAFGDPEKPKLKASVQGGPAGAENQNVNLPDTRKANMADLISRNITGSGDPTTLRKSQNILYRNLTGAYGQDAAAKMLDEINIYNQRPEVKGYSPQQRIQSFYSMPSQNPDVQRLKTEYKGYGYNAGSLYNSSPDLDINPRGADGYHAGGFTEGSMHDLPEEHIAKLLKAGYKIEYL